MNIIKMFALLCVVTLSTHVNAQNEWGEITAWINQAFADVDKSVKEVEKTYKFVESEAETSAKAMIAEIEQAMKDLESAVNQFKKFDCQANRDLFMKQLDNWSVNGDFVAQVVSDNKQLTQGAKVCSDCIREATFKFLCRMPELVQGNMAFMERVASYKHDPSLKGGDPTLLPMLGVLKDVIKDFEEEVVFYLEVVNKFAQQAKDGKFMGISASDLYGKEMCQLYGDAAFDNLIGKVSNLANAASKINDTKGSNEAEVDDEKDDQSEKKKKEKKVKTRYKVLLKLIAQLKTLNKIAKIESQLPALMKAVPPGTVQSNIPDPDPIFQATGAENVFIDATGNHLWTDYRNWSWQRLPLPYEIAVIPDNKVAVVDREVRVRGVSVSQTKNTNSRRPTHPFAGLRVKFQAKHSGQLLAVASNSTAAGGNICQWPNTNHDSQIFELSATGYGDGSYYIKNVLSGKYLGIHGDGSANGDNVVQWHFTGSVYQAFYIKNKAPGYVMIQNKGSMKVLDVGAASQTNGANVQQWQEGAVSNQQFKMIFKGIVVNHSRITYIDRWDYYHGFSFTFQARHSAKSIAINGDSKQAGAQFIQWDTKDHKSMQFKLITTGDQDHSYFIQNLHSGLYIDIGGGSKNNGALIVQNSLNRQAASQKFFIVPSGNGYVNIRSKLSGKMIDVAGQETRSGSPIQQWEMNLNDESMQFKMIPASFTGRLFFVKNKHHGKFVDLRGPTRNNGEYMHAWQYNGNASQKWVFQFAELDQIDEWFFIASLHSSKFWHIRNYGNGNDVILEQQPMNKFNDYNKQFRLVKADDHHYYIQHRYTKKYLAVWDCGNSGNGKKIGLYENPTGQSCCMFRLEEVR